MKFPAYTVVKALPGTHGRRPMLGWSCSECGTPDDAVTSEHRAVVTQDAAKHVAAKHRVTESVTRW